MGSTQTAISVMVWLIVPCVASGCSCPWPLCRSVEVYDPANDKWTSGHSLPANMSFATSAVLGSSMAVLEGATHNSRWAANMMCFWSTLAGCAFIPNSVGASAKPPQGCLLILCVVLALKTTGYLDCLHLHPASATSAVAAFSCPASGALHGGDMS